MANLPPEILCNIFLQCLPIDHFDRTKDGMPGDSVLVPLRISHVCRLWRKMSLSMGELWSHLCIKYHGEGNQYSWPKRRKVMLEVFDTWLRRTGQSALNFAFCCRISCQADSDRACQHVIKSLLAQQHRWKDVYFKWRGFTAPREINMTNMPLLTSLNFYACCVAYTYTDFYTRIDISRSRRLQYLRVNPVHILEIGEESFNDLTRVSVDFADDWKDRATQTQVSMCRQLLAVFPNIEHLSIRADDRIASSDSDADDMNVLNLRNLKTLRLSPGTFAADLLKVLALPGLESLEYDDEGDSSRREIFSDFAHRSIPPLLYLHLIGTCAEENTLIPALRLFPALEELRVTHNYSSGQIFEALTVDDSVGQSGNLLCPALKCLHLYSSLTMHNVHDDFPRALLAMVTSRWTAFGTMFRIESNAAHFPLTLPLSQEEHESFREYLTEAKGLDILSYYTSDDDEDDRCRGPFETGPCQPEAIGRLYPFGV